MLITPDTVAPPGVRIYRATPTLSRFHQSRTFVRGVLGPFGSGKSTGCCAEGWRIMHEQQPYRGTVRTRGLIVRNTYRELVDTVIPTWETWFRGMGELKQSSMTWTRYTPAAEGRPAHVHDVLLRSLDKPQDVKKLLSLELTWAWVNEAREIPGSIIDVLQSRLGRYPAKEDGGPTWFGLFMDTNPPDELSFWYHMFEETRPRNWQLFRQPSGRGPYAENVENLPPNYYANLAEGKSDAWVKVYIDGEYGFVNADGKPIYEDYIDSTHVSEFDRPEGGIVYVGCDWGLTPAAVLATQAASGQFRVHDELVSQRMGAARFTGELSQLLRLRYPPDRFEWIITGDPAGMQESQTDENTVFDILQQGGLVASPAYTNDFTIRRDTVNAQLRTLDMKGEPAMVIHPRCKYLRRAANGGYRYRRLNTAGVEKYQTQPDKNEYSHVAEALQYLLLGAGQGHNVVQPGAAQWATRFATDTAREPMRGYRRGRV